MLAKIVIQRGIMTKKPIKEIIHAKGIEIGIYTTDFENEYISLTDIAKYKSDDLMQLYVIG